MDQETFDKMMAELGLGKDKDKFMRVKIDPKKNFNRVFGADCFRQYYPELQTDEGVLVHKMNDWWYIWDTNTNWCVHDTAFFTWEDICEGMTIIRKRDRNGRFVKEAA